MDRIQTRILVVSHAGVKRINRAVYALLRKYVTDIRIVVPAQLVLKSSNIIKPDPPSKGEAEIIPMDLEGSNPRKYFYPGLIHCLDTFKPDVVLLENDPVSKLGVQLAGWCNRSGSKLICQTYDN